MNKFDLKNFGSDLRKLFSGLNTGFNFKSLGYLPRWVILLLDLTITVVAGSITFLLLKGVKLTYIPTAYLFYGSLLYLVITIFFFWAFRTYSGIIRHSSYIDAMKLFLAQFFTLLILVLINMAFLLNQDEKLFLNTGLFINAVLSFSFLFFYRVIVKQTFEKFLQTPKETGRMKVLLYGFDTHAIAIAEALRSENPSRFKLVGFIDKFSQNSSKRILDLPILQLKRRVPVMMRSVGAEALIIADKGLSKEERAFIVEECLYYNYKVYTIPLVTDWENQEQIAKSIKSIDILDLLDRKPILLNMDSISSELNGKTIMVTGAAGSIGSEIVRQVIGFNPKRVIILDQAETPLHSLSLEIADCNPDIEICNVLGDVRDRSALRQIFKLYTPDVVYHAAAYKHVPLMEENPSQAVFTNILGTKNVADLSRKYKAERFVMVSTDKAVNPSNVMGASKRIAEKYVQALHYKHQKDDTNNYTKFITTRFGNVLGSNGSVVPLFQKQILEGGPITITHPDIIRYFMTIPEACQLVLEAGVMGKGGEIFIFDMGAPVKIIDLARKMIQLAGFLPEKEIKIKIVGLRPGEKLYEELLNDTAKTLPTHHKKIMIAEEYFNDFDAVSEAIHDLIDTSEGSSNDAIVGKMKAIVPEFVSMNSVFQTLDHPVVPQKNIL